ncbi:MAG: DNA cytosine methyltransferase [Thermoguttaceae bacterium]|nr:DNA cytosine methyltransferase [Thermoguttaceae bacterium]
MKKQVKITNHVARKAAPQVQRRIDALKIGQKMQDLPEELWHESFRRYVKETPNRGGGPNLRMIRLNPNEPSLTVTGFIFNKFVHPYENRFITVREAARLQGFPDELEFMGPLTSAQRQVGNAVPVPLAEALFREILSIADRMKSRKKTLTALSLFCGAGGLDIGAERAASELGRRIDVRVATDLWRDACKTLANYRGDKTSVVESDITKIEDPLEFWRTNAKIKTPPDVVFGGPPCQSFSQAGKQKGLNDKRGLLVYDFIRFVEKLSPTFFLMENVSNIKSANKGAFCREIVETFESLGYDVASGALCAVDYGAPQKRKRMLFLGVKKEFGAPSLPLPTRGVGLKPCATVGEAFRGLPVLP